MKGRPLARLLMMAAAAAVLACGDNDPSPQVGGVWQGTLDDQVFTLTLSEASGQVNGNGTITNTPTGTRALTVTGTFVPPSTISLTMSSGTTTPFNMQGTVSTTAIVGKLNGSGFAGEVLILKHP